MNELRQFWRACCAQGHGRYREGWGYRESSLLIRSRWERYGWYVCGICELFAWTTSPCLFLGGGEGVWGNGARVVEPFGVPYSSTGLPFVMLYFTPPPQYLRVLPWPFGGHDGGSEIVLQVQSRTASSWQNGLWTMGIELMTEDTFQTGLFMQQLVS